MTEQTLTPKIGYRRKAAMMLSLVWPDGSVSRATIRAALPRDETANLALSRFLRWCYTHEYATSGRYFIRVLQPDTLRAYALNDQPPTTGLRDFVYIPTVAETVRRQVVCQGNSAIRRLRQAECEFLESLW
jgi:hypothetical protein